MPQVDHRVSQALEGVMKPTDTLKTQEQTPKLIFPGKHPLNGEESLLINRWLKYPLFASRGFLSSSAIDWDIGNQTPIENGFAVTSAVVGAIQTDDAAF